MATALRSGLAPDVSEELTSRFAERAGDVDSGRVDIFEGLRFLAGLGLVGDVDLPTQAAVVRAVSRGCMASAFALWAQAMVVDYLGRSQSSELLTRAERMRRGALAGSTAMAGAFQDADGYRPLGTRFRREGRDVVLDGSIRWASNLHEDGFVMVLGARDADGHRIVVAVPSDADGLVVHPQPELLALGGTASSSLELSGVRVAPEWILTEGFDTFVDAVRPAFLLLQSAFCLGLADAALRSTSERLDGAFEGYRTQRLDLLVRRAELDERHELLLTGDPAPRSLVEIRLDAASLAQDAVALETRVVGGAGYVATSPTARRLREAAFLPIQSPTEGHLRWKLATFES